MEEIVEKETENAAKVPKGYKQTEVGIIPADWDVVSLGAIVSYTQLGGNYQNDEQAKGPPLIKMGNLGRGSILLNKLEFIPIYITPHERDMLHDEDLLFNTRNTLQLVGKVAIWRCELGTAYFNSNILRLNFKTDIVASNIFMNYVLNSKLLIDQLSNIATGTTSVAAIYSRDLFKILIPLPPNKAEQISIAAALNDLDSFIEARERLITKKRAIKQGAMQELLKPKEGWKEKILGDCADVVGGGTPSSFNSKFWNGEIIWLTPTEVGDKKYLSGSKRKITEEGFSNCSANMLPVGTILVTSRAGIGDLGILRVKACTNQGFQSLIPRENTDGEFLYYLMGTLKNELLQNASGSTFLEISPGKMKSIGVVLPIKSEQTRIATILSDMDTEIAQLETELGKYQEIKVGMMQDLLTGKRRLV